MTSETVTYRATGSPLLRGVAGVFTIMSVIAFVAVSLGDTQSLAVSPSEVKKRAIVLGTISVLIWAWLR